MALSSSAQQTSATSAVIYYVPFEVETYLSLTTNNIRTMAFYHATVTNSEVISNLLGSLKHPIPSGSFVDGRVRVLVVAGSNSVWVGAEGQVFDGKRVGVLSAGNFDRLKRLLQEIFVGRHARKGGQ
jgi:hypothetical protein